MLKKTSASIGLVIAAAAGAPLTSSPAYAHANMVRGWHAHYSHRSHHRNQNWNGNRHRGRIFIRIYIYNKNNNHAVAIAQPERRERREPRRESFGNGGPLFANQRQGEVAGQGLADGGQGVSGTGQGAVGTVPVG
ncbi:hypothetical protein [Actinomadura sp. DC4]|uniref:hypothetical protein n=1 Tax=Actinomadura sp. DC4 TaxID=3055069 RepID=UPI0025B1C337|nr:hypothetical protein [Actinomadura sp. DC4]MDN3359208.1 hypothetical protein [Actinomadura sp. DC4]